MSIHSDNLNLNLNLDLGASGAAGGDTGYGRARFNTEDMDKLMPVPPPATLTMPQKPYAEYWDGELRAWAYVAEFISAIAWPAPAAVAPAAWPFPLPPPVNNAPILYFIGQIAAQTGVGSFPVPDPTATNRLDANKLADQAVGVVNASLDRADRALEICDQATAPGALNYWTGLIRINPSQDRSAWLLMLVARKIGEYVAMGLKAHYRMRRPSQVYPYILPIIDPPDTPSFPSSHSLQAHLISNVLMAALTPPAAGASQTAVALDHLAHRVARNREIAGVHYPMDSACGAFVARGCMAQLLTLPAGSLFADLLAAAKGELSDLP
ncbi:MAG: phosphatase PAP2 family protein [Reyranella sp.]|uniref:phosphatase PAP2 family protein n=1 Tax=Reyranella sp. TaxID=1929291 RepID=UPI001AC4339A|nr:phosphatase PAP2 family protein [Reyranella sp.]MBN9087367.1 phosphatase PAP2 family protein [Reyranella sp.]